MNDQTMKTSSSFQLQVNEMLRVEWLGQMAASIFWIVSVLTYGISSAGDWLQMLAASSWFVANVAAVVSRSRD